MPAQQQEHNGADVGGGVLALRVLPIHSESIIGFFPNRGHFCQSIGSVVFWRLLEMKLDWINSWGASGTHLGC